MHDRGKKKESKRVVEELKKVYQYEEVVYNVYKLKVVRNSRIRLGVIAHRRSPPSILQGHKSKERIEPSLSRIIDIGLEIPGLVTIDPLSACAGIGGDCRYDGRFSCEADTQMARLARGEDSSVGRARVDFGDEDASLQLRC